MYNYNVVKVYRFYAVSGTKYYILGDDRDQGSGNYTLYVKVSAGLSEISMNYFSYVDRGYNEGKIVTPTSNGYVYIKVAPYNSSSSGTFAIAAVTGINEYENITSIY